MLPSEIHALKKDIQDTLDELDAAILLVKERALQLDIPAQQMLLPSGEWVLHPLLIAKASALNAYVALNKE